MKRVIKFFASVFLLGLLSFTVLVALLFMASGCATATQSARFPNQSIDLENLQCCRIYVFRVTTSGFALPLPIMDGDRIIGDIVPFIYLCWERLTV